MSGNESLVPQVTQVLYTAVELRKTSQTTTVDDPWPQ